jgi:hypothetical protein
MHDIAVLFGKLIYINFILRLLVFVLCFVPNIACVYGLSILEYPFVFNLAYICVFIVCLVCVQYSLFLLIVNSSLPLRFSLMFICY